MLLADRLLILLALFFLFEPFLLPKLLFPLSFSLLLLKYDSLSLHRYLLFEPDALGLTFLPFSHEIFFLQSSLFCYELFGGSLLRFNSGWFLDIYLFKLKLMSLVGLYLGLDDRVASLLGLDF